MSGIQPIDSTNKKPLLRADNTGYAALIGMGLTSASIMIKNKSIRKYHKHLGIITAALTLLHLGVILKHKRDWKNKQKEFIG